MKSTIDSLKLLLKIIWKISTPRKKIQAFLIIIFSIFSSILQYINIIITAITFSYITSSAYSGNQLVEFDILFGKKIELSSSGFLNIILFWILSAIFSYCSVIVSSYLSYKISYNLGNSISNEILKISICSNSLLFEDISEKTIFNLLTSENTKLIKGAILSLITLPMLCVNIFALVSIIINYSFNLFLVLPLIAILYFLLTNLLFVSVSNKGKILFDLRSTQTDILSRVIDNYLDVKFPPSDKAYKKLFNKVTSQIRNLEAFLATLPKALKAILELVLILLIGTYIFYSLSILNLPLEIFISSSAAIILSLLKLTPILSSISSNFLAFNEQFENIKNNYLLIFDSKKYSLFSNYYNYAQLSYGENYELNFKDLKSNRIFKYSNDSCLNLTLKNEKLIWIVGKSGCGKSTLLSMVAGIRPIKEGKITLSIKKNNVSKNSGFIHKNIAYMPQNPIFHSLTIRDYINDGEPKLDYTKLKFVIRKLKIADSFGISSKKILDLLIGPKGYAPSGGQSKLLAFARALYKKDVFLYLLDEPTSELSEELKSIVLEAINELSREKFVLCITHNLKEIKPTDQVLYL